MVLVLACSLSLGGVTFAHGRGESRSVAPAPTEVGGGSS